MRIVFVFVSLFVATMTGRAAELSIYERGPSVGISHPYNGSMYYDGRSYKVKGDAEDARRTASGLATKLDAEAAYATRSLIDAYLSSPPVTIVRPVTVQPAPVYRMPAPSVTIEEGPVMHYEDAGVIPSPFPWDPYGFYEHSREYTRRSRTIRSYTPAPAYPSYYPFHPVRPYPYGYPGVRVW